MRQVSVRLGAAQMPPGTNRWIGLQKVFVSKSYCSAVGDKWSKLPGVQNSDNLQIVSRSITMKGRVETLQRRQNVLYEGRNDIALFTECIRFCNPGNTTVEFEVQNMKLRSLTLSSNDLLQKQRASQLLRKFSALYSNRMFFTVTAVCPLHQIHPVHTIFLYSPFERFLQKKVKK